MVFSSEEEGWVKPIVKMVRRTNTPTDIAFDYLCVEWSFAWRLLLLGKLLKYFNIDHKGAWRQLQRFRARNKINTKSSKFLRGWKIDKRSDSYSAYSTGKIIKLRGAVSSDSLWCFFFNSSSCSSSKSGNYEAWCKMEIVHPCLSAAIDDRLFAVSSQKSYKVYF